MEPSPYQAGAAVGGNVSGAFRDVRDTSALDQILTQYNQSGSPEDTSMAMQRILSNVSPEKRQMAMQVIQNRQTELQNIQKKRDKSIALQKAGLPAEFSAFDDSTLKFVFDQKSKNEQKQAPLKVGLKSLDRIDELLKTGSIGTKFGSPYLADPLRNLGEKGRLRSEMATLGRSLIPLAAAGLVIRNQREFDAYSKTISDPDSTPADLEGAVKGLRSVIQNNLKLLQEGGFQNLGQVNQQEEEIQTETVVLLDPMGNRRNVPANKVEEFLSKGGKRVG